MKHFLFCLHYRAVSGRGWILCLCEVELCPLAKSGSLRARYALCVEAECPSELDMYCVLRLNVPQSWVCTVC